MSFGSLFAPMQPLHTMPEASGEQTRDLVSLPTELWFQILQDIDVNVLWQLRFLCSTFHQVALDKKFEVLDLSFISNIFPGMQQKNAESGLDRIDNRVNLAELPNISKRFKSLIITPHLEYTLNIIPPQPEPPSLFWRLIGYQDSSSPRREKELAHVAQLTARLERVCHDLVHEAQITSLTISSLAMSRGHIPPHPDCGYITSVLRNLSHQLQNLKLDLSSSPSLAQGLGFSISATAFPHLETFELELPSPAHWCIPELQKITSRSPQLHTVKLRSYLFARAPNEHTIPTPFCLEGIPLPAIRTLNVNGGGQSMELDISFDILPILPQIEDFTISSRRYHGEYIQHLNPLRLHRLFIYVLGEHSAYLDVAKRLGGADSALQELVLEIPGTTHNQMATILPFFPCLTHLSLHVFSWDTVFLTYLPVLAPGLRTLSMRAVDSIVLHNQWRGTILKVQKPYGFCESLACEIATMKCELWKGWTLESVEFSVTSDERLSLAPAATAFAERLPNCRAVTRKGQD